MRTLRSAAALSFALLVVTTIGVAGAGAAPPDHAEPSRASAATTAAEQAAVQAYWTPTRMANAVAAEALVADREPPSREEVETGPPSRVAPTHHRPDHAGGPGGNGGDDDDDGGDGDGDGDLATVTGATWEDGGLVASTTGKLFFTLDDTDYVCSASVVTATNDNTLLTAGHCIHAGSGGDDGYAKNVAFVPAYNGEGTDQEGLYGVWAASELATTGQWADSGDLNYDVGFIEVKENDGNSIADAVGAQGIAFNDAPGAHVYAFGYPHAAPYDGTTLTYCAGETVPDRNRDTYGLTCDMTGGSSGGPWYSGFDGTTGSGTASSVNSYGYTRGRDRDKMFGPTFGTAVKNVYDVIED